MDKTTAAVGAVSLGNSVSGDAVREAVPTLAYSGGLGTEHATVLLENGLSLPQEHLNRMYESGPAVVEQGSIIYYIGAGYLDHAPNVAPVAGSLGDTLHIFWDWYSSYALSLFLMFYGQLDDIVSVGGFILLIIRLIADGPRAYRTLKGYFNGK